MTENEFELETETVGVVENVILGVLLDKADLIYPLTLAEHIADALRDAGLVSDAPDQPAGDASTNPRTDT